MSLRINSLGKKGFLSWPILLVFLLIMLAIVGLYLKPMLESFNDTGNKYINPDITTEEGMYNVIKNYVKEQRKYAEAIDLATEFINTPKYGNSKYLAEVFYLMFAAQVLKYDYNGARATMKQYIDLKYRGQVSTRIFPASVENPQVSISLFQLAVRPGTISTYDDLFSQGYLKTHNSLYIEEKQYVKWPGLDDESKYAVYVYPFYIGWYMYIVASNCDKTRIDRYQAMFQPAPGEVTVIDYRPMDEVRKVCPAVS